VFVRPGEMLAVPWSWHPPPLGAAEAGPTSTTRARNAPTTAETSSLVVIYPYLHSVVSPHPALPLAGWQDAIEIPYPTRPDHAPEIWIQTLSITVARPCPTPMHSAARP